MTDREQELCGWLNQACAIILLEARDHEDGRQYDSNQQRRSIAKTLRGFVDAASKVMSEREVAP